MRLTKRLLSSSILSILDQGILSALNFGINLLLMNMVLKEDYGTYTQIYGGALLVNLLLDSLIGGPLTNIASVTDETTRSALIKHYWFRQIRIALILSIAGSFILHFFQASNQNIWTFIGVFGCYLLGNSVREYGRTVGFINGDIISVFSQDILYVMSTVSGLFITFYFNAVTLENTLICIGIASAISSLPSIIRIRPFTYWNLSDKHEQAKIKQALFSHHNTIKDQGKWAIVGAIVGWLTNYSYLYLSDLWINSSATADLSAIRQLLMPIPLVVTALARMVRPDASRYIADGNWGALNRLTLYAIVGVESLILVYVTTLAFIYPWLLGNVIAQQYSGLQSLIIWWGVYFAIYSARWIGTSWLTSGGAFRTLFMLGSTTLVLVLAISAWAMPKWGTVGALIPLICAEIFELIIVWKFILPKMRAKKL